MNPGKVRETCYVFVEERRQVPVVLFGNISSLDVIDLKRSFLFCAFVREGLEQPNNGKLRTL